ncbi:hypothetical protein PMZ80_006086 [Knufia obscura]|uniref:Cytochrome P450 n=1 Tax=Knufia obscura TaxID=1635080 RepID=A0ABR0RNF7_9EURO|nr:hypothetical protein PMZ80_006086 [Knufia obscura]
MLLKVLTAVFAGVLAWLAYFVNDLVSKRKRLAGLPQPPMTNLLLGHLEIADECRRVFPKGIHSHAWADYIREKWKLPETFYVDWRPFGPLWLFTADPELSNEFFTIKQSLPKSSLMTGYLIQFLGKNNMLSIEGAHHKSLRTMFNPGFSSNNIMTYADAIVEASLRFLDVLKEKAKTKELFELEEYATRLTIDIIGLAVFDTNLQAQTKIHPIIRHFRERVLMMPGADTPFFFQDVQPTRGLRLWWNNRKLNAAVNDELNQKIQRRAKDLEDDARGIIKPKKKSIIDLALNTYEKEMSMGENVKSGDAINRITDSSAVPPQLRQDLIDSIKTIFFAGHDTTSSTLAWCYYLLHRHPEAQAKLTAELDDSFPPGTSAAARIKEDPYIINKLEYTTACIRETLRIFPSASTIRQVYPSAAHNKVTDPRTGVELDLEDAHIWPAVHLINRNKRIFPQPLKFVPERFIQHLTPFPDADLFKPAGKNAFQPFGAGPRSCIGQELAMIESRIVLALTAREVDFVLEFPGEEADPQPEIPENTVVELGEKTGEGTPNVVEGHRVWQTLKGSAKPAGGCPGRVYLRTSA